MKCPGRVCDQQRHVLDGVTTVIAQIFAIRPVADDLVIVPLPDLRNFGIEAAQIFVYQFVFMAATEFIQGFGNLADF